MNKNKASLYSTLYPVDLRDVDSLGTAYCCDEVKMTHADCEGMVCVFCEDACPVCEVELF